MAKAHIIDCHPDDVKAVIPRSGLLVWLGLLAVVFFLAACGPGSDAASETEPRKEPRNLQISVGQAPGGGTAVTWNGVRMEVATDVHLELPVGFQIQLSSTTADGERETYLSQGQGADLIVDGDVVDIRAGRLYLGDTDCGAVAEGDTVRISAAGVVVDRPAP